MTRNVAGGTNAIPGEDVSREAWRLEIVNEVRRVRDKLASQCNYNIHAIFADLRAHENRDDPGHPLVKDVGEWTEAAESGLALREQPKQQI